MRINRNLSQRQKRHIRVRGSVFGTAERPRLNVFRSSKHIYAQVIDDTQGRTVAAASTMDKELRDKLSDRNKTDEAREVGKLLAERARDKGVSKVVFDRGGWLYHGRVKSLADGAREQGLEF